MLFQHCRSWSTTAVRLCVRLLLLCYFCEYAPPPLTTLLLLLPTTAILPPLPFRRPPCHQYCHTSTNTLMRPHCYHWNYCMTATDTLLLLLESWYSRTAATVSLYWYCYSHNCYSITADNLHHCYSNATLILQLPLLLNNHKSFYC